MNEIVTPHDFGLLKRQPRRGSVDPAFEGGKATSIWSCRSASSSNGQHAQGDRHLYASIAPSMITAAKSPDTQPMRRRPYPFEEPDERGCAPGAGGRVALALG